MIGALHQVHMRDRYERSSGLEFFRSRKGITGSRTEQRWDGNSRQMLISPTSSPFWRIEWIGKKSKCIYEHSLFHHMGGNSPSHRSAPNRYLGVDWTHSLDDLPPSGLHHFPRIGPPRLALHVWELKSNGGDAHLCQVAAQVGAEGVVNVEPAPGSYTTNLDSLVTRPV